MNMTTSNDDDGNDGHEQEQEQLVVPPSALRDFAEDVASLWCPRSVAQMEQPPSPTMFYRDYVSKSVPCVIHNALTTKSKGEKVLLDFSDIMDICKDDDDAEIIITVNLTPDGHGDVVRTVSLPSSREKKQMFVKPCERKMTLMEFHDRLLLHSSQEDQQNEHEKDDEGYNIYPVSAASSTAYANKNLCKVAVPYYSAQNDCLRTEFSTLLDIIPDSIDFAEDAFGVGKPDAINLWIGDERSVSSMHKDHYENLFYVASGEKVFYLCPPCDAPFLYENTFESGSFACFKNDEWAVVSDVENRGEAQEVKWIECNVQRASSPAYIARYPLLKHAHVLKVVVRAGELLYIPALWYHQVTQTKLTVGINYWYDMKFDTPHWCYYNFLQKLEGAKGDEAKTSNVDKALTGTQVGTGSNSLEESMLGVGI